MYESTEPAGGNYWGKLLSLLDETAPLVAPAILLHAAHCGIGLQTVLVGYKQILLRSSDGYWLHYHLKRYHMNQLEIIRHEGAYWYRRQSDPKKMKQLDMVHPAHLVNALKKAVREIAIVPRPIEFETWVDAVNSLANGIQLIDRYDYFEETGKLLPEHREDIQRQWMAHISEERPNTEVSEDAESGRIT